MRNNWKVLSVIILASVVLVGSIIGWTEYDEYKKEEAEKENADLKLTTKQKEINPFGNTVGYENIDDSVILGYIHRMSHQKVHAEEKWGFYEITDERIDWLIEAVKQNEPFLVYGEEYTDILTRWSDNEFSSAVDDHNFVWRKQGGTDESRAERLLTTDEELDYVENTTDLQEENKDVVVN